MNVIDLIKDQFSSEVTRKLGSLIGGTESETKSALSAAVPALLAAFSRLASAGGSDAESLASAVNKFDADSTRGMANLLTSDPEEAAQQGNDLLGSLLGAGPLSAIVGALSKFVKLDSGTIKKLLAYASPLVLGTIAKQFQGKPATAQGLSSFFSQQRANIADAMPSGFSLPELPGLPDVAPAARAATAAVHQSAAAARDTGGSLLRTIVPLAALAAIGYFGWQYFKNRGEVEPIRETAATTTATTQHTALRPVTDLADSVPDVSKMSDDLTSFFKNATQSLSEVTDIESAKAALPKLTELDKQIDDLSAAREKLPMAARSTIGKIVGDSFGKLSELIEKVLAIPGVRDVLGPVLDGLVPKLKALEANS